MSYTVHEVHVLVLAVPYMCGENMKSNMRFQVAVKCFSFIRWCERFENMTDILNDDILSEKRETDPVGF